MIILVILLALVSAVLFYTIKNINSLNKCKEENKTELDIFICLTKKMFYSLKK